jgi:hypothetical protein
MEVTCPKCGMHSDIDCDVIGTCWSCGCDICDRLGLWPDGDDIDDPSFTLDDGLGDGSDGKWEYEHEDILPGDE